MCLFSYSQVYYSTYESMISFVGEWKLDDAEIMLRTIVEGTIKYLYLSLGDLKTDKEEIIEFYSVIPMIQNAKNNNKKKSVIDEYKHGTMDVHPFTKSLMSDEEIEAIFKLYPRKIRQEIERRWSFGHILGELIEDDENITS